MILLISKNILPLIVCGILATSQAAPNAGSLQSDTCPTDACENASKTLKEYMDQSVKPCDNFYQFACGGYIKNKVIPDDSSNINVFQEIFEVVLLRLRGAIEAIRYKDSPLVFNILQNYYHLCMDNALIEKTSEEELRDIIDYVGGWPVLNASLDGSKFNWKNFAYDMRSFGYPVDFFIGVSVDAYEKNSTMNVIKITEPSFAREKAIYSEDFNGTNVQAYLNYSIAIAEILGASRERARAELEESLKFEIKLAKEPTNASKVDGLIKLQDLQSRFPNFPWAEYLDKLFSPTVTLRPDDDIWVKKPGYLEGFFKLMNETPKRVIANYAVWRLVEKSAKTMGVKVQDATHELEKATLGVQVKADRWKTCIGYSINGPLLLAASALYVDHFFDKKSKKEVTEIIDNVRESFREIINETQWMDEETKKRTLEKLDNMIPILGHPEELLDIKQLNEYYNFSMDSRSFLKNELKLLSFEYEKNLESLREENIRGDWRKHGMSAVVNAFYSVYENTIDITAGLLQGLLFVEDRPKYMNYGTVGWIVGHEFTHGFDSLGHRFDKEGSEKNWWDPETAEKFKNRTTLLTEQYSRESVEAMIGNKLENLKVNARRTEGENIADNGGIKEAYRAYIKWEERNDAEAKLPGLSYSPRQLFWISAATAFCESRKGEDLKEQLVTDIHAPAQTRVMVAFSNMPEFSEDFSCPEGSRMNPKEKHSVW